MVANKDQIWIQQTRNPGPSFLSNRVKDIVNISELAFERAAPQGTPNHQHPAGWSWRHEGTPKCYMGATPIPTTAGGSSNERTWMADLHFDTVTRTQEDQSGT